VARVLIVGGGCRGLLLARDTHAAGHAVRIVTRAAARRAEIEATGAECWIGTPERLQTLRMALESVTIACWLLGTATGPDDEVRALHGSRLQFFVGQIVDTTVRGFVYEAAGTAHRAAGTVTADVLAGGAQIARAACARNAIPLGVIDADPRATQPWLEEARAVIASMLGAA